MSQSRWRPRLSRTHAVDLLNLVSNVWTVPAPLLRNRTQVKRSQTTGTSSTVERTAEENQCWTNVAQQPVSVINKNTSQNTNNDETKLRFFLTEMLVSLTGYRTLPLINSQALFSSCNGYLHNTCSPVNPQLKLYTISWVTFILGYWSPFEVTRMAQLLLLGVMDHAAAFAGNAARVEGQWYPLTVPLSQSAERLRMTMFTTVRCYTTQLHAFHRLADVLWVLWRNALIRMKGWDAGTAVGEGGQ